MRTGSAGTRLPFSVGSCKNGKTGICPAGQCFWVNTSWKGVDRRLAFSNAQCSRGGLKPWWDNLNNSRKKVGLNYWFILITMWSAATRLRADAEAELDITAHKYACQLLRANILGNSNNYFNGVSWTGTGIDPAEFQNGTGTDSFSRFSGIRPDLTSLIRYNLAANPK